MKGKLRERLKERTLSVIFVSAGLILTVLFFGPFELFANNREEMPFGLWDFFGYFVVAAIILIIVISAVLILLPKKLYKVALVLIGIGAFMVYLQGNFFTIGLNSVAGDGVGKSSVSTVATVLNIAVWILIVAGGIVAVLVFGKKHFDIIKTVTTIAMITVLSMQAVSMLSVSLSAKGVWMLKNSENDEDNLVETATFDNLDTVGKEKNIIYFVVDRFSSSYVDIAKEECPEIFDELDGFTYYDDMVSLYPRTYPSVAYMMTGVEYDSSYNRADYFKYAYNNSVFLDTLHNEGYGINFYSSDYESYESSYDGAFPPYADNSSGKIRLKVFDKKGLITDMTQLTLYKYLPFAFRNFLGSISTDDFSSRINIDAGDKKIYSLDMKEVYGYLNDNELKIGENEKKFSFIHITGCHLPNKYDRDFNIADSNEANSVTDSMIQSFKIINLYIEQMKKLGIYESSTIIITGDHTSIGSDIKDPYYAHLTALFVKSRGVGEGELKTSSAPVAQEDIHATIFDSEGIETTLDYGMSIFDIDEDTERVRRYYFHKYIIEEDKNEIIEYKIIGLAKEFNNWNVVKRTKIDEIIWNGRIER